jgi:hypothetical protein
VRLSLNSSLGGREQTTAKAKYGGSSPFDFAQGQNDNLEQKTTSRKREAAEEAMKANIWRTGTKVVSLSARRMLWVLVIR